MSARTLQEHTVPCPRCQKLEAECARLREENEQVKEAHSRITRARTARLARAVELLRKAMPFTYKPLYTEIRAFLAEQAER